MKLVVYDESFAPTEKILLPSPLRVKGLRTWHDPWELLNNIKMLVGKAERIGVRALGIALYRASPAAWRPGGEPLSNIVLWLDREFREEAVKLLPLLAKIASRLPVVGVAFSPASPLPAMSILRREYGGRVWTIDSLVAEWVGAGFVTVASVASLTGIFHPTSLRRLTPLASLAGIPANEIPLLVGEAEVEGRISGVKVSAIAADQQAALIGLGCLEVGCVKLALGTGGFATSPHVIRFEGVQPLTVLLHNGRVYAGSETMIPGIGMVVERLAPLLGGFREMEAVDGIKCLEEWNGGVLAMISRPHSTPGGHLPTLFIPLIPEKPSWLSCSIVIGLGLTIVSLLAPHVRVLKPRVMAVGGLSRIRGSLDITAAALGLTIESYPHIEASARGVAFLAAVGVGDFELKDVSMLRPEPGEAVIHEPRPAPLDMEMWWVLSRALARGPFISALRGLTRRTSRVEL